MTRSLKQNEHTYTVTASTTKDTGGRYMSLEAYTAARKAGRIILRKTKNAKTKVVYIELTRITRGEKRSTYHYKVERTPIPKSEQKTMKIGGNSFTPTETYVVESVKSDVFESMVSKKTASKST
jgi:hypothetical protein